MQPIRESGVELDLCLTCNSIWFDAGELNCCFHANDINVDLDDIQSNGESSMDCPNCRAPLAILTKEAPPIRLDFCQSCHGVFFNSDTLDGLLNRKVNKSIGERSTAMSVIVGALPVLEVLASFVS
jgi:Zn-finger nucleic acid-binding protein